MGKRSIVTHALKLSWADVSTALQDAVQTKDAHHRWVSATVPCQVSVPTLHQLAALPGVQYLYDPDLQTHVLGIHVSGEMMVEGPLRFRNAREQLQRMSAHIHSQTQSGIRFLGGFAFEAHRPSGKKNHDWNGWPDGYFVLPKFLMIVTPVSAQLTATLKSDANVFEAIQAFQAWLENDDPFAELTEAKATIEVMQIDAQQAVGYEDFRELIEVSTTAIDEGQLEKVVVARSVEEPIQVPVPTILHRLFTAYEENCFVFSMTHQGQHFVGATPERLVRMNEGQVQVDCLAGTEGRGATQGEDEALALQLLNSDKNLREHSAVVQWVTQQISPHVTSVEVAKSPSLRRLKNVQHLFTPLTASTARNTHILELVEVLHPTPAVAGVPREVALTFLAAEEGLERGWYAGPVGWLNVHGEGAFAVALRSGLLSQTTNTATLFAGVGIVRDSEPASEWNETELKLQPMRMALSWEGECQ